MQSVFGNLPRSGGLAPRGSGAADAQGHTGDEERRPRSGSVPLWRNGGHWVTWAIFLFVAYIVYRVAVR